MLGHVTKTALCALVCHNKRTNRTGLVCDWRFDARKAAGVVGAAVAWSVAPRAAPGREARGRHHSKPYAVLRRGTLHSTDLLFLEQ